MKFVIDANITLPDLIKVVRLSVTATDKADATAKAKEKIRAKFPNAESIEIVYCGN